MTRRQKRQLAAALAFVTAGVIVIVVVVGGGPDERPPAPGEGGGVSEIDGGGIAPAGGQTDDGGQVPDGGQASITRPKENGEVVPDGGATTEPVPQRAAEVPKPNPDIAKAQAKALLGKGLEMSQAGALVEARTALSEAIFSGKLDPVDAQLARAEAWSLARKTIFSSRVYPGDMYAFVHKFEAGDTLEGSRGLIKRLDLRVTGALLERINNVSPQRPFMAGKPYKLLKGPFHAIVHKSEYVMDLYLQREENGRRLPKTFIRRLAVGLGRNGTTPLGSWIAYDKAGGKGTRAPYNDPQTGKIIHYGEPDYPFGEKGLWIRLHGIDENTRMYTDRGIHSTDEPESIGKAGSAGCIRLADGKTPEAWLDGIDLVFRALFAVSKPESRHKASTVWIRP